VVEFYAAAEMAFVQEVAEGEAGAIGDVFEEERPAGAALGEGCFKCL
jgi:hypothetical protein